MTNFYIITPSYNQAKYIRKTIDSVLSQKGNFKIHYLIMDGGSTDGTKKILISYKDKIKYVSKKDGGQSDAINLGIKKILKRDAGIFAYINSDDYYSPGAFEEVLRAFKSDGSKKWLIGDCKIVSQNDKEIQKWVRFYKKILRTLPLKYTLGILNPIAQPAVFIKVEAVRDTGLFDQELHLCMDYDYWQRLSKKYSQPIVINKTLANFRIHQESKGKHSFVAQFDEQFLVAKKYHKSKLIQALHKIHNFFIIKIYLMIK